MGCPIRTPVDQRFFAAPHGFSQLSTSFIAIACLGIHRTPLLTCPCMACTNIVHATQAMSSILCYLAFYHTIHLRGALKGPHASFTIQHVKEQAPHCEAQQTPGETIPDPARCKCSRRAFVYSVTKINKPKKPFPWSYRDSNPGPLPCKGSALAS